LPVAGLLVAGCLFAGCWFAVVADLLWLLACLPARRLPVACLLIACRSPSAVRRLPGLTS
jgi:hypothetical protein